MRIRPRCVNRAGVLWLLAAALGYVAGEVSQRRGSLASGDPSPASKSALNALLAADRRDAVKNAPRRAQVGRRAPGSSYVTCLCVGRRGAVGRTNSRLRRIYLSVVLSSPCFLFRWHFVSSLCECVRVPGNMTVVVVCVRIVSRNNCSTAETFR